MGFFTMIEDKLALPFETEVLGVTVSVESGACTRRRRSSPCADAVRRNADYRAVYTAKLANTIYVLHVFQKKATRGIAMPKHELDLVKARVRWAEQHARSAAKE